MSYKNFSGISPLVAVYATATTSTTSTLVQAPLDTNLHSGNVSSSSYTNDFKVSVFGDWYGYANNAGFTSYPFLEVDGVEQNQGVEIASGANTGNRCNDIVFANANPNLDIDFYYKRGSAPSWTMTSTSGYPRVTGVTTQ